MNAAKTLEAQIKPYNKNHPYVFVSYSKKDAQRVYQTVLELQ